MLALLYSMALLAGFLSPYAPTTSPNRDLFYHPPSKLSFRGPDGELRLRPFVSRMYVKAPRMEYASGIPLFIHYRSEEANRDPLFRDEIESAHPVLHVLNSDGRELARIHQFRETDVDSAWFATTVVLEAGAIRNTSRIEIHSDSGRIAVYPVGPNIPSQMIPDGQKMIRLHDSAGNAVRSISYRLEKHPVRFLVRGWKYRIFGFIESDLHLFGVESPGYVFLLGTDQAGRDILSRTLHGARISLTVGIIGVLLSTALGLFFGGIAGFYGRTADSVVMRISEILMSIPPIYLILSVRNAFPYRLQETYDKIQELGIQTFAWHEDEIIFATVLVGSTLLLGFWSYKRKWSPLCLLVSFPTLAILVSGPSLMDLLLFSAQRILPGSTYLTSGWTYFMVILIISLVGWAAMSRVVRGMVYSLREEEYVMAARALGASDLRLMMRHILPNTLGYVIARGVLLIPAYILGEVTLSFLGVGVQEPNPSWGNMLSAAQNVHVLEQYPWMLAPGIFIFLTVLSFDLIGEKCRIVFHPRSASLHL